MTGIYRGSGNAVAGSRVSTTIDILDEDDMVSDRSDAIATQQSIKAYVDTEVVGAGGGGGGATQRALVYHGTQSIASGGYNAISFNQEIEDTDSFHDTVTNNGRLTIPAGVTAVRVSAGVDIGQLTSDDFGVKIKKNTVSWTAGLPTHVIPFSNFAPSINVVSAIVVVTTGDYFTVEVYQAQGTAEDSSAAWFAIEVIE